MRLSDCFAPARDVRLRGGSMDCARHALVGGLLLLLLPLVARSDIGVDAGFGNGGVARILEDGEAVRGWRALPDGGFIAAGRATISPGRMVNMRLYRLDPDGRPLLSWGRSGSVELALGPFEEDVFDAASTSILGASDDGRVLVGVYLSVVPSSTQRGRGYGLRVAALLRPDGGLDTGFGRGGLLDLPAYGREEHRAALLPDGTVYTTVFDMLGDVYPIFVRFERYARDGRRDQSFNYRGPNDYDSNGVVAGPLVQPDGRLWIFTLTAAVRLLADGSVDRSFGNGGAVDIAALLLAKLSPGADPKSFRVAAAVLRDDGQVAIACNASDKTDDRPARAWGLALLDADGRVVNEFGGGGQGVSQFVAGDVSLESGVVTSALATLRLAAGSRGVVFASLDSVATDFAGGALQRRSAGALLKWSADGRVLEGLERNGAGWFSLGSQVLTRPRPDGGPVVQFGSGAMVKLGATLAASRGIVTAEAVTASSAEEAGVVSVAVMRAGGTRGAVSVRYSPTPSPPSPLATASSDATAGLDYEPFDGQLDWVDGEAGVKYIRIRLLDDAEREGYETVGIALEAANEGVPIAQQRVLLQIASSDLPVTTSAVLPNGAPGAAAPAAGGGGGALPLGALLLLAGYLALVLSPMRGVAASLDPAFGSGGILSMPVGAPSAWRSVAAADGGLFSVQAQPDAEPGRLQFRLRRYTAGGQPDEAWSPGGMVTRMLGPYGTQPFSYANAEIEGLTPDGRLVVRVGAGRNDGYLDNVERHFVLLPNGQPDSSFGLAGQFDAASANPRLFEYFLPRPDGGFLSKVFDVLADGAFVDLRSYSRDGSLDAGFRYRGPNDFDDAYIVAIVPLARGRFAVVTTRQVAMFLPSGAPDVDYGEQGLARLDALLGPGAPRRADGAPVQELSVVLPEPDGSLLLALTPVAADGSTPPMLIRLDPSGRALLPFASGERLLPVAPSMAIAGAGTFHGSVSSLQRTPQGQLRLTQGLRLVSAASGRSYFGTVLIGMTAPGMPTDGDTAITPRWVQLGAFTALPGPDPDRDLLVVSAQTIARIRRTPSDAAGILTVATTQGPTNEESGFIEVAVLRTGGDTGAVSVEYQTTDIPVSANAASVGAATAGVDYVAVRDRLEWKAGETGIKFLRIPLLDDSAAENVEVLRLQFDAPAGGVLMETRSLQFAIAPSDRASTATSGNTAVDAAPAPSASAGGSGALGGATLFALLLGCAAVRRRCRPRSD